MVKKTKKINFVPRNANYSIARHLDKIEQRIYEEAIKKFEGENARESLNSGRRGSNLFKILLLNQEGIETATHLDLGLIAEQKPNFLRGFYEVSSSIVLRSEEDSYDINNEIIKSLFKSTKDNGFKISPELPFLIWGLGLKEDKDSYYGLKFVINDNTRVMRASELAYSNNERKFTRFDNSGMPIFDDNGDKTLYTRGTGISPIILNKNLDLYSNLHDINQPIQNTQLIVVDRVSITPDNREDYVTEIRKFTEEKIKKILKYTFIALSNV